MPKRSAVPAEDEEVQYVLPPGRCRKCNRRRRLSYDRLCLLCLVWERDGYKMDSEAGSELIAEAHGAFSGLAGELLEPCQKPCAGHLGPQGKWLYDQGLDRYRALAEAKAAKEVAP